MTIPWVDIDVPYIGTEDMVEVDRAMIEDFGIDLVRMMENAGRSLAHLARVRFLDGNPPGKTVVVLAGTGGNGGGALVAARRLHGYGAEIRVAVTAQELSPVAAEQLRMLEALEVPITTRALPYATADLIIDGLIGYSLRGNPRGRAAELILWANDAHLPVLSLDVPSGVDASTGAVGRPAIRATATMTLALPKRGLRADGAAEFVGELYLADISVPRSLYARPPLNLEVGTVFAASDVVRLA